MYQLDFPACLSLSPQDATEQNASLYTATTRAKPSRARLLLRCLERNQSLLADQVSHCHAHGLIFWLKILDVAATHVEEACKAQARAIELTDDEWRLVVVHWDEVCRPEQGQGVVCQAQSLQVEGHLVLQLRLHVLVWEAFIAGLVDRSFGLATDATDVDVVFDPVQLFADHDEACLTLVDARQEALIDHLATSLDTTLEVLTRAFRGPSA